MSWQDFFYFSKGERRGLIVLLCLISIAGILLIVNDKPEPEENSGMKQTLVDTGKTGSVSKSTDSEILNKSSEGVSSGLPPSSSVKTSSPVASSRSETDFPEREKPVEAAKNNLERVVYGSEEKKPESVKKKESVPERVKRLTSYSRPSYPRTEKYPEGTVVELNTADTVILKKVPGIGSAFAKRIINYRNLLGGYYSVMQLSEVYGIDEDKYNALVSWFSADISLISKLNVNDLSQDSLRRHPYIDYRQAKVIAQLRKQKGKLTGWENLLLLDEFTDNDRMRLQYYLSFE